MNEGQKAQAVALLAVPEIRAVAEGFRTSRLYFCVEWWVGGAKFCARNALDDAKAAFEKAVQLRTAANLMEEVK